MARKTLGLFGAGAFGGFALHHLKPHFDVRVCDPDIESRGEFPRIGVRPASMSECAGCDIVLLCVPVQVLEPVCRQIAPLVKAGSLVIDTASVKVKPARILRETLPAGVDIVCTHPLFGPQSGDSGITGLKISVCEIRGNRASQVGEFLSARLGLDVIVTTPEAHDRELAYVQGLTHLLGRIFIELGLERFAQTTKSFDLLTEAVSFIREDSEQLFNAIERDNPYAATARQEFFDAVAALAERLAPR